MITGNKIIYADPLKGRKDNVAFDLTACTNVLIEKNNFDLPAKPLINTQKMTNADLKTDLKVNIK
jgi:hypothetical protein